MKVTNYKTALIQDPKSIGLGNLLDMQSNLLGFFHYADSLHKTMAPTGTDIDDTTFIVNIVTKQGFGYYTRMLFQLNFYEYRSHGFIEYGERRPRETFKKPFELHITVHTIYDSLFERESPPPAISKSFQTDKCVVCLDNPPSILYFKCLHYNVCEECEKANPFRNCPTCRTIIETKVSIKK